MIIYGTITLLTLSLLNSNLVSKGFPQPASYPTGSWPLAGCDAQNSRFQKSPGRISVPTVYLDKYLGEKICSIPLIGDVDCDGDPEILITTLNGSLFVVDGECKDIKWSVSFSSPIYSSPAFGKLFSGNGFGIVVTLYSGEIYCLSSSGETVWKYSTHSLIKASPVLADINNDYWPEVIVGGEDGVLYILSHSGTLIKEMHLNHSIETRVVVGDVDMDGGLDTIFVTLKNYAVYSVDSQNFSINWKTYFNVIEKPPFFGDVNTSNPGMELLVSAGPLTILNASNGVKLWRSSIAWSELVSPSLSNLDRFYPLEIISVDSSSIFCLKSTDGGLNWIFSGLSPFSNEFSTVDIDGDGYLEIVAVTVNGEVCSINCTGKADWVYNSSREVSGGLSVGDVNGDSLSEIVFGTLDGHLIVLTGAKGWVTPAPDLAVSQVECPNVFLVGEKATFQVTVSNLGSKDAYNFNVSLFQNGNEVSFQKINHLPSGSFKDITLSWVPNSTEQVSLRIVTDPENVVIERFKWNNEWVLTVTPEELTLSLLKKIKHFVVIVNFNSSDLDSSSYLYPTLTTELKDATYNNFKESLNVFFVGGPLSNPLINKYNLLKGFKFEFFKEKIVFLTKKSKVELNRSLFKSEDYGVISVCFDRNKFIVLIEGITRYGTAAACKYLMENFNSLPDSQTIILKWIDVDSSRSVTPTDSIEVYKTEK